MAYTTHNTRASSASTVWQHLVELRTSLAERAAKYRLYRATLNELASMSDRELLDIGLDGVDIRVIAYKAAYST